MNKETPLPSWEEYDILLDIIEFKDKTIKTLQNMVDRLLEEKNARES